MALYAAIGVEFKSSLMKEFESLLDERIKSVITKTLKQVAHDYELNYKELKSRYCSKESLDEYDVPGNTQVVTVDLEEHSTKKPEPAVKKPEPAAKKSKQPVPVEDEPVKVKAPKAKAASAVMALSKMKKGDLVKECEERGLDSEGTVAQLKERVKDARDGESEPVKKKEKAPAPKKEKAPAKKKEKEVPPPPVVLEEEGEGTEDEGDGDVDGDICQRVDDEDDEFEFDGEDGEDDNVRLQRQLSKLLAEANEEEDYEDED
jgi:hypothetical protein